MEMEDHHHQYGINDLKQLVNGPRSTHFPSIPPPPPPPTAELFPGHPNLTATHHHHHQHYEMMMFGRQVAEIIPRCLHDFASTGSGGVAAAATTPTTTTTSASTPPLSGLEAETAGFIGGDASTGRWPRQETLTLLDIRSRLDIKFKEANQKGPLWDEVSRIMTEEHGYQRSGKKCREKFENLYKYYKKTKEGKAGRQDGKHYRFFRQLEALYGQNTNQTSLPDQTNNFGFQTISHDAPSQTNQEMYQSHDHKHCDSLSLSTNSTDFDTSSSEYDNDSMEKRRKRMSGRSWKVKIKDFIDSQMKKLVEKQEEWLDKLMKTMEKKENERVLREEEWRRQEVERLEREHKFWAKERAWIEARDVALMEALQKLTGSEIKGQLSIEGVNVIADGIIQNQNEKQNEDGSEILNNTAVIRGAESCWLESEITRLLQLRSEMETRFRQSECSEEIMWEEIATKMACFGYERNALMLKEKWESIISNYPRNNNVREVNKKRKESSRGCFYFDNNNDNQSSIYTQGSAYCDINDQREESARRLQTNDGSSPSNSNVGNLVPAENCFPFLMSCEGGNLWENYNLKVNKTNQNHNQ